MTDNAKINVIGRSDAQVTALIMDTFKYNEEKALEEYLSSTTKILIDDIETGLWRESALVIFDLFMSERETGNPRNSEYIKGE